MANQEIDRLHTFSSTQGVVVIKAKVSLLASIAALTFLAAPIANAAEPEGKGGGGGGQCGPVKNPNSCRGKCLTIYMTFICDDPKPGQVAKHRHELMQCYKACKESK